MTKTEEEAVVFLKKIFETMDVKIDSIEPLLDEETGLNTINIKTPDSKIIGRDGECLQSIGTLLNRFLESNTKEDEQRSPIMLDVNDFQKKHIETLKTKAHMMAERAKFFKSSIELDPMNGYERRIIHTYLEKDKNISTESIGAGKERRIVVTYKE